MFKGHGYEVHIVACDDPMATHPAFTRCYRHAAREAARFSRLPAPVENRCILGSTLDIDDHLAPDDRVMEVLSEHRGEGWLEGYQLTGGTGST